MSNPPPDGNMLLAAACTGFFGFLHGGKFTVPTPGAYDNQVHLNLDDLAIDSLTAPSMVRVHIKQSKTDPFRQGTKVYLGAMGSSICPVQALWQYLAVRGPAPGLLFIQASGIPYLLVNQLQEALESAGIDASAYNGHSFRIGMDTTAAQRGIEDFLIQTQGQWKSAAYSVPCIHKSPT